MVSKRMLLVVGVMACGVALSACGKKEVATEKTSDQLKSEREASAAKARESAVFGSQLQSMDKAKATADEAAKVAAERAKKADQ